MPLSDANLVGRAKGKICLNRLKRLFPEAENSFALESLVYGPHRKDSALKPQAKRIFYNWPRLGRGPDASTCRAIANCLIRLGRNGNDCRDHLESMARSPFWTIICTDKPPTLPMLDSAFSSLELQVRKVLGYITPADHANVWRREVSVALELEQIETWDSLVACLLLAKQNFLLHCQMAVDVALLCALSLFPRVLARDPTLLDCGSELYKLLLRYAWTASTHPYLRTDGSGMIAIIKEEIVVHELFAHSLAELLDSRLQLASLTRRIE